MSGVVKYRFWFYMVLLALAMGYVVFGRVFREKKAETANPYALALEQCGDGGVDSVIVRGDDVTITCKSD